MNKNNGIAEILLDFQIEYDIVKNDLDVISNKLLIADRLKKDNLIISNYFKNGFMADKEKFRSIVLLYFYKALEQAERISEYRDTEIMEKWSQRKRLLAYLIDFRDFYIYYKLSENALNRSHRGNDKNILDVANFNDYFYFIKERGEEYERFLKDWMGNFPTKYIKKVDKKDVELTELNDIFENMLDDVKNGENLMLSNFKKFNDARLIRIYTATRKSFEKVKKIELTNFLAKIKEQINENTENLSQNIQSINTGIRNMSGEFASKIPPLFLIPIFIGSVKYFDYRRSECDKKDYGNLFFAYIKKENDEKNLDINYHSNLYHLMALDFMSMHSEISEEDLKNLFRVAIFIDFLILILGNKAKSLSKKVENIYSKIWKSINAADTLERVVKNNKQMAREIYNNISLCFNKKIAKDSIPNVEAGLETIIKDIVYGKDKNTTTNHFKNTLVMELSEKDYLKGMCLAPFEYLSGQKVEEFNTDINDTDKTFFGIQEEILDDFVNFISKATYELNQRAEKEKENTK